MHNLFDRRAFLSAAALGSAALVLPGLPGAAWAESTGPSDLPGPLPGRPAPISREEREGRLTKLRGLMRKAGISALLIEPGSSLIYFTGVEWHRSERPTLAIVPADGQIAIVTPFFERPSVKETLKVDAEVRVWQEDENPMAVAAAVLKERKATGTIAFEETLRYFMIDGLAKLMPSAKMVSGATVVRACRLIKSPAEIALLQHANDVTIAAYKYTIPRVKAGMHREEIARMMVAATNALGGQAEGALILIGEAAAYPHGSHAPQIAKDGNVVLMDCGCTVEGYTSDISRTFVPGGSTARQRQVYDQVRKGQMTAMGAAKIGAPAGSVDDAVRHFYESLGYGPGYKLPGLSHRTGHGIGLDGHEPVNLVHGETMPLAAGMCFSNEPGIYIPGEFGVRIEDCFHITEAGPKFFSEPPATIDTPLG